MGRVRGNSTDSRKAIRQTTNWVSGALIVGAFAALVWAEQRRPRALSQAGPAVSMTRRGPPKAVHGPARSLQKSARPQNRHSFG
jgi:hypothetical protein